LLTVGFRADDHLRDTEDDAHEASKRT